MTVTGGFTVWDHVPAYNRATDPRAGLPTASLCIPQLFYCDDIVTPTGELLFRPGTAKKHLGTYG